MYRIDFLPIAYDDLSAAIQYILDEYEDIDAADSLMLEILTRIEHLGQFPYSHPLYRPKLRLPSEIRCFSVRKYLIFYAVLEPQGIVEIRRIIYNKMDIRKQDV